MVEHINPMDYHIIVQLIEQELIKCCFYYYKVVIFTSPSQRLSNPCFFMAAIFAECADIAM